MREHMLDIMARVLAALERYDMDDEDRAEIIDAVKEICYAWARTNAVAYVCDMNVQEQIPEAARENLFRPARDMEAIERHIWATYPLEWMDDEEG